MGTDWKKIAAILVVLAVAGLILTTGGYKLTERVTALRDKMDNLERNEESQPDLVSSEPMFGEFDLESQMVMGNEEITVTLFFMDSKNKSLEAELRAIAKVEGIARSTVEELIKGPSEGLGLQATIPTGTVLNDINVKPDGTCIVDLSNEFLNAEENGVLAVYSIVNSLTQFPSVQKVQLWIDGQHRTAFFDGEDLTKPLTRRADLIQSRE